MGLGAGGRVRRAGAIAARASCDALHVSGPDDLAERIRQSVAITAAEGTARIRFMPDRVVGRSFESVIAEHSSPRTAAVFGFARRAVKRGLAAVPQSSTESGPAAGQIDFAQRRSVYKRGTFWSLCAPGRDYAGQPGAWAASEHDGIVFDEPFWLLELIAATVDAADGGGEWVRGVECRRYRCAADFERASADAARRLATRVWSDGSDPARLAVDVWLDDRARIRRVRFDEARSQMSLELFDFGEPLPIDLPPASEIVPESS
jgi:hypothetical protein